MSSGSLKNFTYKLNAYKSYKQDLALNNPQELISHKTQPKQTKVQGVVAKLLPLWIINFEYLLCLF